MANLSSPLRRRARKIALSTGAAALCAPALFGAQFSWTNVTDVWNNAANWIGGLPVSADATELIFGGSGTSSYTSTNNFPGVFTLNALTLNSTSTLPQTINAAAGSSLSFVTNNAAAPVAPPAMTQNGSGAFSVLTDFAATNTINLGGTGAGLVTLGGLISGAGGLNATAGNWRVSNPLNTFSGPVTVGTGALVEIAGASGTTTPQTVNFARSATGAVLGNSALTIDGGTFKITTQSNESITFGGARPVIFGPNGGVLDITNTNAVSPTTAGGNIAGGDLLLTLNNGASTPAVVRWNGGQNGLSSNSATNANWDLGTNTLRFGVGTSTGPLRIELTNGAMMRGNNGGGTGDNVFNAPLTIRGVLGGDPTSGAAGTVSTGVSRTTGRMQTDAARINYVAGVTFEGAMQISTANRATALNGNMTIASNGYVAFQGRGSGAAVLSGTLATPGSNATPSHNVLYVGETNASSLTIQSGGIAQFDGRLRTEQPFAHGVLMGANATLNAGGTLRIAQSMSNFSAVTGLTTTQSVGDIILRGNVIGQGSTESESLLDIRLPAPDVNGSTASGVPLPLTSTPLVSGSGERPFAGLVAEASNNIVVNGSGFGGLKVLASARPNRLFSATGVAGGAAAPDPTSNVTKLNGYLTPARLAAITGSGGYFTPGATGEAWTFPAGGEWAPAVPVGLRVANDNAAVGGTDMIMGASSWSHNLVVSQSATLDTGAAPFSINAGTLHGSGNIIGAGGITIASGATLSPGLNGPGALTVGSITLAGNVLFETAAAGASDQLVVLGDLSIAAGSTLTFPAGNTYPNADLILGTFTGSRTGTFTNVVGLPSNFTVDYASNSIRLLFTTLTDVWNGNIDGTWNKTTANWQGGVLFADFHKVLFDDTAAGTKTVTITGGNVSSNLTTVNTAASYSITGTAGNAIVGTGPLVKTGTGTLILAGPHAYTGGTEINGGVLRLGADNSLPDAGAIVVASGATLDANGKTETIGALTVNGTLSGGGTVTAASARIGAGATGTLSRLTTSSLSLGDGATLTAGPTVLQGDVVKTGSGSGAVINGAIDLGGGQRTFNVEPGTGTALTLNGALSNGGLIKSGDGTLLLNAANTYAGATSVTAGTVKLGAVGAYPTGSDLTVAATGALDATGFAISTGALSGAGSIAMGPQLLTVNSAASSTFSGSIASEGAMQKSGAGVLTMSGPNIIPGGITIDGGTLRSTNAGALGSLGATTTVKTGGVLVLSAHNQNAAITMDGGTLSSANLGNNGTTAFTGDLTINSASTIEMFDHAAPATRGEFYFTSVLRGTGNLFLSFDTSIANADAGPGFRPANILTPSDYSGTITVGQRGKLDVRGLGGTEQFSTLGSATIRMMAGTVTTGPTGSYSQLLVRADHSNNFGHPIEIVGTGTVNISMVNIGTSDANAEHTFGDLKIGNQQRLANAKNRTDYTLYFPTVHLQGGMAELSPNDPVFNLTGASFRLGAISENVPGSGWSMEGLGRVTLSGDSNYTGPTRINEGTVIVNGTISGTSSVLVNNGILGGDGVVNAPVSLGDGTGLVQSAVIAPGAPSAIGTLSTGAMSLAGDAEFRLELNTDTLMSDKLQVTGALTLGTDAVLSITNLGFATLTGGEQFTLATATGGVTGHFFNMENGALVSFAGTDYNIRYLSNSIILQAVPEPGAALLCLTGATLLGGLRRRKPSPRC